MLSSSSSVFDNLPTRPPTPPRDITKAVNDAISFLDDSNEIERALKSSGKAEASLDTAPQPSPLSSQESPASSNAARRVGFTPRPTYHHIARNGQLSSPSAQLRKSIPSRRDAKPLKSILKQTNLPPPPTPDDLETAISFFSPQIPGSFAKMLQSVIQQLAGQSVTARLDAYLALNGALKAYEGVPDAPAMATKMSLLMQFITRDMAWKNASGALDTNIVTQALKLTAAILYDAKLSVALDDDFKEFLIDRSIAVVEHTDMPKAIFKTHMSLLAQQRFHSRIMTAGRAERIITSMQNIEEKCSGNSAVATRLVIYQRLLEQKPAVMLNRMRDWLEHVMHGMLSSIKDIRIRAIDMCTQAGLVLGNQTHATKALLDMFNHEVEEAQSYCDYLGLRLVQMITEKEAGAYVPQIWSAVILFFRNKRYPLEKWAKFKTWLMIIQRCLNSSDLTIRYQGHLAWNKLVFTVMPDSSLGQNMFDMLKVPPKMGMDKRGADSHSKQVRQYALESYYNLLHYGLRPGLSHEELDSAWDVYVEPILAGMIKANGKGRHIACGVIHGLCTASTGLWNVHAANEAIAIKPEELPRLEPRWIRSRLARILKLMESILLSAMWMPSETTAAVDATWYALIQSLAEAGGQEVKTSNELKEAVALLVNFLRRLWAEGNKPPADTQHRVFTDRYIALLSTAVRTIGPGPFAEDILTKTKEDAIQAALTPSHRSSKHHSAPRSPFVFLFSVLYETPPVGLGNEDIMEVPTTLLQLLVSARLSPTTRMELLQRSAQAWATSYASEAPPDLAGMLWACIADCAVGLLEAPRSAADEHESQTLGLELRNSSSLLAHGMRYLSTYTRTLDVALLLFNAMLRIAQREAGIGGTVLAVIEPFAKVLVEADSTVLVRERLQLTSHILKTAAWPRSRQELDQARRVLWGVGLAPHKSATFDPFDNVYQLANDALLRLYNSLEGFDAGDESACATILSSLLLFIKACPLSLLAAALRKLQQGLVVWVEDTAKKTYAARELIFSTWQEVLQKLEELPQKETTLLKALEPLIIAGFSSPHKAIVNQTIVFWNANFGCQATLEYPPRLASILRAWSAEADLTLPGFPDSYNDDSSVALPAFFETQTDASLPPVRPQSAHLDPARPTSRVPSTAPVNRSTQLPGRTGVDSTRPASSPVTGTTEVPVRFTPKVRLRHNDSQVEFAPIDTSSVRYDDSQMLTERQKEVKARQHDNAQMFPDLSSSPIAKPSTSTRSIQKRLDFTSDTSHADEGGGAGTPMALPDPEGPMSDDIPSSPTPSSTKDVESARIIIDEDHDTEAEDTCDPPSSPPQQGDEDEEAGMGTENVAELDTTKVKHEDDRMETDLVDHVDNAQFQDASALHQQGSDLPSDTLLPTEQLLHEEEAAAILEKAEAANEETEGTTFFNPDAASPENAAFYKDQGGKPDEVAQQVAVAAPDPAEGDVTRVEDSFVDIMAAEQGEDDAESNAASQQSHRSSRKRKRPSSNVYASKKRKQQSPLKQAMSFFSSFVRGSQQEDEEDMEDEIVVASSQPSHSPASTRAQQAASSSSMLPVIPVKDEPTISQQTQKRGRGRPRKSETPTPAVSQTEIASIRSLKRKASALSTASVTGEPTTSFVKDTPAPSKTRKQRRGPDAKLIQTARLSQDEVELGRATRRAVAAVVVPENPSQEHSDVGTSEAYVETGEHVSPEKQLAIEGAAASNERPIATPRSILGRLRDVLADLPKMILGSQEEREMDNMLFEIRKKVFEAGKRAKE